MLNDSWPGTTATRTVYTRDELLLARGRACWCQLPPTAVNNVHTLGLRRHRTHRGSRAGCNKQRPIRTVDTRRRRWSRDRQSLRCSLDKHKQARTTPSADVQTRRVHASVTQIVDQSSDRQPCLIHVKCVRDPSTVQVRVGSLNVQSIGGKSAVLSDFINNFDVFAAVETWHDSANCPNVIASTPPGYRCVEKA